MLWENDYSIEKAVKNFNNLHQEVRTDKNGHQRKVWVKNGEKMENKNKPVEQKKEEPKAPKPSVPDYVEAKSKIKKIEAAYKKDMEEYEAGQRMRANGGDKVLNPMYGSKPKDLSQNEEYQKAKKIVEAMENN